MTLHRHFWRTEGPSLFWPGAVRQRCQCGAFRVKFLSNDDGRGVHAPAVPTAR